MKSFFPILTAVCLPLSSASAALILPSVFGDNMVLQRGQKVRVWGWDKPGAGVQVKFAGRSASAKADGTGRWDLTLDALVSGGPSEFLIQGSETRVFQNVVVGEIWLCSGQSNMEWGFKNTERFEQDKAQFEDSELRLFKTNRSVADKPMSQVSGKWQVAGSKDAEGFSAVGLYFANRLRRELGVPVGLIQSAWGGTPIEAWMSRVALEADPENQNYLSWTEANKSKLASGPFEVYLDDLAWTGPGGRESFANFEAPAGVMTTGASDGSRSAFDVVDLAAGKGKAAKYSGELGAGGWVSLNADIRKGGAPFDARSFDAFEFRARGKGPLKVVLGQDSVKDWSFHRSKEVQLSDDWRTYRVPFSDLVQPDWGQVQQPFNPGELVHLSIMKDDPAPPSQPGCLYNAMIVPHIPFGIQGVLWYQGESNAWKAELYAKEFKAMIRDWRKAWGRDFQFLFVQLANFMGTKAEPGESEWAELRESQAKALDLPNTGMAVAIDIGNPKDIHPRNKKDLGERLARWALANTYGKKMVASGPIYRQYQIANGKLQIEFSHGETGLKAKDGEDLRGFAIAGEDKKFYWAKAKVEGGRIVLSNPEVGNPVAARYGWDDSPDCNLVNGEGLPASPFRTDDWPGLTAGRR